MSTTAEMIAGVRSLVRDFPQFFETEHGPLTTLTIRLPHPLVAPGSLQVYVTPNVDPLVPVLTDKWQLDERNGVLKLTDQSYIGQRLLIAGYHYVWFSDSDIARATQSIAAEITYTTPGLEISDLTPAVSDVAQIGIVVHLLWSLCIELALDIDVSTPEGMFIPAHQRYAQALQMMQFWEGEYQTRSQSLNLGYGALEIFSLRRIALTTGRYVPVYQAQEIDDHTRPKRLYPPIPSGVPAHQAEDNTVEVIDGVEIYTRPPHVDNTTVPGYPSVGPGWMGVGS